MEDDRDRYNRSNSIRICLVIVIYSVKLGVTGQAAEKHDLYVQYSSQKSEGLRQGRKLKHQSTVQ